jgi:hypothetical protein
MPYSGIKKSTKKGETKMEWTGKEINYLGRVERNLVDGVQEADKNRTVFGSIENFVQKVIIGGAIVGTILLGGYVMGQAGQQMNPDGAAKGKPVAEMVKGDTAKVVDGAFDTIDGNMKGAVDQLCTELNCNPAQFKAAFGNAIETATQGVNQEQVAESARICPNDFMNAILTRLSKEKTQTQTKTAHTDHSIER